MLYRNLAGLEDLEYFSARSRGARRVFGSVSSRPRSWCRALNDVALALADVMRLNTYKLL
jgi:hypothetical protein